MADIFSKIQELIWWAWSYPVPWVWIGFGVAGLVGLVGVVGVGIGLKMKRDDRKNALKAKSAEPTPSAMPS
jgi:hypothetical protein